MADINYFSGNLTRDPELRYLNGGTPAVSFTLAETPRRFNEQTKSWEDAGPTRWLNCDAYDVLAENIAASFHKGDRAIVKGELRADEYTDKQGQKRSGFKIKVEDVGVSLRNARVTDIARNERRENRAVGNGGSYRAQGGSNQSVSDEDSPF